MSSYGSSPIVRAAIFAASVFVVVALTVAATGSQPLLRILIGLLTLGALLAMRERLVRSLLVGSLYMTRFRLTTGSLTLLPEHLLLLVSLIRFGLGGRLPELAAVLRSRPMLILGAFIGWGGIVSLVEAPTPLRSMTVIGWMLASWLIAGVLCVEFSRAAELIDSLIRWGAAVAFLGILLYLFRAETGGYGLQRESETGGQSLYGLSFEANIYAASLAVALYLLITRQQRLWSLRVDVATGLILFAALVLAQTRAAIVGLAVGLLWWAIRVGARSLRPLLVVVLVLLITVPIGGLLFPQEATTAVTKLSRIASFDSGNGRVRADNWRTAIQDLDGKGFIVGLGVNSFGQLHEDPTRPGQNAAAYLGNVALQVLHDTGLIGVALLAWAVASIRPRRKRARARGDGLILLVGFCSLATSTLWFGSSWALVALALLARSADRAGPSVADQRATL